MTVRAAVLFGSVWACSFLFALASAGFATGLSSSSPPSVADLALCSIVGVAVFSFPVGGLFPIIVSTCGAPCEDIVVMWSISMVLLSSIAPAFGGACLGVPNSITLFSGGILTLFVMAAALCIVPFVYVPCRREPRAAQDAEHAEHAEHAEPVTHTEHAEHAEHATRFVVVVHPRGECDVAHPDTPP